LKNHVLITLQNTSYEAKMICESFYMPVSWCSSCLLQCCLWHFIYHTCCVLKQPYNITVWNQLQQKNTQSKHIAVLWKSYAATAKTNVSLFRDLPFHKLINQSQVHAKAVKYFNMSNWQEREKTCQKYLIRHKPCTVQST